MNNLEATLQRLQGINQAHHEAGEMFYAITGRSLARMVNKIGDDYSQRKINLAQIQHQIEVIEKWLQRLAAPNHNWN